MKKSKLFFIVVLVAVVVAVGGFAYKTFSDRYGHKYFGNTNADKSFDSSQNGNTNVLGGSSQSNNDQDENGNQNVNENSNANSNFNDNVSIKEITNKDCDNDCVRFKGNEENFKYCQEVCGNIPVSGKNSEEDCVNLTGLNKEYCYRDLAVSKKDSSICNKISDSKLKTTCKNRVTEELLN